MTNTWPPRRAGIEDELCSTIETWVQITGASEQEVRAGLQLACATRCARAQGTPVPSALDVVRSWSLPTDLTTLNNVRRLRRVFMAAPKPPKSGHDRMAWRGLAAVIRAQTVFSQAAVAQLPRV